MSKDNTSALIDAINKAVEEKTFSIEVLQRIADLRTSIVVKDELLKSIEASRDSYLKQYNVTSAELVLAKEQLAKWAAREKELSEREKAFIKLECQVEMQKALAAQSKEFVGLIFRNQTIMTSKLESIAVDGIPGNQYNPVGSPGFVTQNQPSTKSTTVV